jgi:hypothetical protein
MCLWKSQQALGLLKSGAQITSATHCHQIRGGQDIDIGVAEVTAGKKP